MKATEQYFPVVLFIMLWKVRFYLLSLWMKSYGVTIQKLLSSTYLWYCLLYRVVQLFHMREKRYCLGLSYGFVKYFDKSWILYPTTKTLGYTCKATAGFSTPVGFRHILVWPWDPAPDLIDQSLELDVALGPQCGLRYPF